MVRDRFRRFFVAYIGAFYTAFCLWALRTVAAALLRLDLAFQKRGGRGTFFRSGVVRRRVERLERMLVEGREGGEPASRHRLVSTNLHDDNDEPFRYTQFY